MEFSHSNWNLVKWCVCGPFDRITFPCMPHCPCIYEKLLLIYLASTSSAPYRTLLVLRLLLCMSLFVCGCVYVCICVWIDILCSLQHLWDSVMIGWSDDDATDGWCDGNGVERHQLEFPEWYINTERERERIKWEW